MGSKAHAAHELRILDAVKRCCERWGIAKVTVDDVATEAGVSRATLYRLFPGGKDVLFDALRVRQLDEFFGTLTAAVDELGPDADLESTVVQLVTVATRELHADDHLAVMLASEPGGILTELTVDGLPRILRVADHYLAPLLAPHLPDDRAPILIDLLVRITISYFLAPSEAVDLADPVAARSFLRPGLSAIARSARSPVPSPSP